MVLLRGSFNVYNKLNWQALWYGDRGLLDFGVLYASNSGHWRVCEDFGHVTLWLHRWNGPTVDSWHLGADSYLTRTTHIQGVIFFILVVCFGAYRGFADIVLPKGLALVNPKWFPPLAASTLLYKDLVPSTAHEFIVKIMIFRDGCYKNAEWTLGSFPEPELAKQQSITPRQLNCMVGGGGDGRDALDISQKWILCLSSRKLKLP